MFAIVLMSAAVNCSTAKKLSGRADCSTTLTTNTEKYVFDLSPLTKTDLNGTMMKGQSMYAFSLKVCGTVYCRDDTIASLCEYSGNRPGFNCGGDDWKAVEPSFGPNDHFKPGEYGVVVTLKNGDICSAPVNAPRKSTIAIKCDPAVDSTPLIITEGINTPCLYHVSFSSRHACATLA